MWLAACTAVVYEHKDDVYVKAYFADMAQYVIVCHIPMHAAALFTPLCALTA